MDSQHGGVQDAATRILLVDDDPTIVQPLSRLLGREGFVVHAVGTGADALRALAHRPHLVILDLGLPDTDGLHVCRQLRAAGHQMPVLVLSARVRTDRHHRRHGRRRGRLCDQAVPVRPSSWAGSGRCWRRPPMTKLYLI